MGDAVGGRPQEQVPEEVAAVPDDDQVVPVSGRVTASAVRRAPTAAQSESAQSSALRKPSEPSTGTSTLVKS